MPADNPAAAVYGLLAVGALLAAESGRHESHLDALLSALIATATYWLLHAYTAVLGRRLTDGERLSARALLRALVHDWTLLRGAAIPVAALLVAWVAGATKEAGVTAALWSAAVSLVAFELLAALRTRSSAREVALETAVGLTMGIGVLGLRIVLH